MPLLVPRVGEQHHDLVQRRGRNLRRQHLDRVVSRHPQVRQLSCFGLQQRVTDAGRMHLDAEVVARNVAVGLGHEEVTVAEADLDGARCRAAEQRVEIGHHRAEVETVARPQLVQRALLRVRGTPAAHDEAPDRAPGRVGHDSSSAQRENAASMRASICASRSTAFAISVPGRE